MKMSKALIALVAVSMIGWTSSAMAQTTEGDFEVSGQLNYLSPGEGDDILFLNGGFGYFIKDNISISGTAFLFETGGDLSGTLGPAADYYFNPEDDTIFFSGGSLQIGVGDDTDTSFEIHVGAKRFLTERVTLNGQLGHNDALDGQYLLIGLSYFY